MDYSTEDLPASCLAHFSDKGNFQTRNARFRTAVCQHLGLHFVTVNGSGNCFFDSVTMLLREAGLCPNTLNALQLRRDVVQFFRACIGVQEDCCERIINDIVPELNEQLICSSRAKVNGVRVQGLVPATIEIYLDAVEQEGVWVTGSHWMRTISFLYNVRVAVVIYGHHIIRFFGQGPVTIFLYKIDAETHFDPMLRLAPGEVVVAAEPPQSAATAATLQCTLPHSEPTIVISSSSSSSSSISRDEDDPLSLKSSDDKTLSLKPAAVAPGECAHAPHYGVHFLMQSQCVALPECSANN